MSQRPKPLPSRSAEAPPQAASPPAEEVALTDDDLVVRILGFQRRLFGYIITLIPHTADAEDVLQETNSVLLRKRRDFTPGTDFAAWACSVAFYEVLAYRKRKAREQAKLLLDDELVLRLAQQAADRVDLHDDRLSALGNCLAKLPERDRDLIALRYRTGLTSDAIGARTGRSAESVRRLLFRIRSDLLGCVERQLATEGRR